jgi:hypothetical protein
MTLIKKRLSRKAKDKNKKQWYKDMLDAFDPRSKLSFQDFDYLRYKNDKINYNLFNGIIDKKDFEHIYAPYGAQVGELPADFTNKDIISTKIKVLLGMEMERPSEWDILAVNPEATTRKEQSKFNMIKQYVIQEIMLPIRKEIELAYAQKLKGQELSDEENQQIQQQIQKELEAKTPEEVDNYMKREHQDPAEILMVQILNFLIQEKDIIAKFNVGFKHATASSKEIYWIGETNNKPDIKVINPLNFSYDKNNDDPFIENGEWAGVEYWMTPTEVITIFGSELSDSEIDDIYDGYDATDTQEDWSFNDDDNDGKIRVLHRTWKALRKIGFLTYFDEDNQVQTTLVSEDFKFDKDDPLMIDIKWEWIPEVYEGYKISKDIYTKLRPVPGQYKNMENLYECYLPYIGGVYDSDNSVSTSLIDRMKEYQWYYNVIMYRIQLLMASDKGKLLLMNINMIPTSANIDMKQWLYYADALKIGWVNPNEEGNQGQDVANAAKEIDMSLISDIQKYIELANYIDTKCGQSIGVTKEMEAQISQYQAVRNTEQALAQANYIVEPYFDFHNHIKKNVLTHLVNTARTIYAYNDTEVLDYMLDDFSREIIRIDKNMLAMSHYALFITNSMKIMKIKTSIENLALTSMQNQSIELSDVIKVLKNDNINVITEQLEVAEDRKYKKEMEKIKQTNQGEMERIAKEQEFKKAEWAHEIELAIIKEEERRKTVLQQQAILAMGFDEEKDRNKNNVPDVLEVANAALDANLKTRKQDLDEEKFNHQKEVDKKKLEIEDKKASQKPAKSK